MTNFRNLLVIGIALIAAHAMAVDGRTSTDFTEVYEFIVEVNGVTQAEFRSVTDIRAEIEVIEYSGGGELTLSKRPSRDKTAAMPLARGPTLLNSLLVWWRECMDRECAKRSVSVHLYDKAQSKTGTYNLTSAFPKTVIEEEGLEQVTFEFDLGEYVLATDGLP